MKADRLVSIGLAAALLGLVGTTAWAAVSMTNAHSTTNYYGGMIGRNGTPAAGGDYGSMMGSGSGGMMAYASASHAVRVSSLPQAKELAQQFADRLGLKVDEVLQFERNYYVKLVDKAGAGATEVLVDPATGTVSLEYGPAMMWNTRYGLHGGTAGRMMGSYGAGMMGTGSGMMGGSGGMMGGSGGGMMGGAYGTAGTASHVSIGQARQIGQRWLDANRAGLNVESGGDSFPGYYTFEVLKQGEIQGMLSVNASSGAVMYHWWHGAFVAELK
jgi:hypothetical protein